MLEVTLLGELGRKGRPLGTDEVKSLQEQFGLAHGRNVPPGLPLPALAFFGFFGLLGVSCFCLFFPPKKGGIRVTMVDIPLAAGTRPCARTRRTA